MKVITVGELFTVMVGIACQVVCLVALALIITPGLT